MDCTVFDKAPPELCENAGDWTIRDRAVLDGTATDIRPSACSRPKNRVVHDRPEKVEALDMAQAS
jgi:hypothetical protein